MFAGCFSSWVGSAWPEQSLKPPGSLVQPQAAPGSVGLMQLVGAVQSALLAQPEDRDKRVQCLHTSSVARFFLAVNAYGWDFEWRL